MARLTWQRVWREAIAPHLSRGGLTALRLAVEGDSPHLIQGHTTEPPPMRVDRSVTCEGACGLAYPLWQGLGLVTVGEVMEAWLCLTLRCEQRFGLGSSAHFTRWWDLTPRHEARRLLLAEVNRSLGDLAVDALTDPKIDEEVAGG